MILDDDDSLRGNVIVQESPVIKESKSKYKYGVEHRFYLSPEKRYKADEPLLNFLFLRHRL